MPTCAPGGGAEDAPAPALETKAAAAATVAVRPDQWPAESVRAPASAPSPWPRPKLALLREVWTLDPLAVLEMRQPDLLRLQGQRSPSPPPKLETSCFLLSGLKFPSFLLRLTFR